MAKETTVGGGRYDDEVMKALEFVSGVSHYSVAFFQFQVAERDIIDTFHETCRVIRAETGDASIRADLYDQAIDAMDIALIEAVSAHYPKDKDGNWTEAEEAPIAVPALAIDNTAGEGGKMPELTEPVDTGEVGNPPEEPVAVAS